jgi:cell division septum initiation protein DivIVA
MTDDEINQVLRNYDLSQVDQVLAAIKKCLAVQNELIEDQRGRIKVLKEEVEWAVNGMREDHEARGKIHSNAVRHLCQA